MLRLAGQDGYSQSVVGKGFLFTVCEFCSLTNDRAFGQRLALCGAGEVLIHVGHIFNGLRVRLA